MAGPNFLSIAEELLDVANAAFEYFKAQQYTVKVEHREVAFPRVPTLVCRRGHETLIVEVASSLDIKAHDHWLGYGRSCTKDTRLAVVIRSSPGLDQKGAEFAVANKVGVYTFSDAVSEILSPGDLAMNVHLPELSSLPPVVRKQMAPVFKKWSSDWRDALDDACQTVEVEARKYLKTAVKSQRVIILDDKGRPKSYTDVQIGRMTLGQLSGVFDRISNKTAKDSFIANTLPTINPERVGLAHKKPSAKVETRLRKNAGSHMWAITNCLVEMSKK